MKKFFPLLLIASCAGAPAYAQTSAPQCALLKDVVSFLSDEYGETLRSRGVAGSDMLIIFTNPDTGTFSAFTMTSDGVACLRVSGEGWEEFAPPPNL